MKFIIEESVAQALANYLITKPWGEVNKLLGELQQIKPLPEDATTPSAPPAE